MASRLDDRAWELVRAVAAIEPSAAPEVAMQILVEMHARAVALLAASDRIPAAAQGARVPFFGLSSVLGHVEPAEDSDWDLTPDLPIPRD